MRGRPKFCARGKQKTRHVRYRQLDLQDVFPGELPYALANLTSSLTSTDPHLLICLLQLKSTPLCKNILRALSAAGIPSLETFSIADQVSFRFYTGVLAFLDEEYEKVSARSCELNPAQLILMSSLSFGRLRNTSASLSCTVTREPSRTKSEHVPMAASWRTHLTFIMLQINTAIPHSLADVTWVPAVNDFSAGLPATSGSLWRLCRGFPKGRCAIIRSSGCKFDI